MDDMVYAFVDTNILLHYRPLAEIDWCGLLGAKAVCIEICMPVIQELDRKKSDPRLSDRAKRAIKEIRAHKGPGQPLRANVKLELYKRLPRRDQFPEDLDFEITDDLILALVRDFPDAHPVGRVFLITEDFNMEIRCEGLEIPTVKPLVSDRLPNPGDETDKKLKRALAEVASLRSRQPKLSVVAANPCQEPDLSGRFECELLDNWVRLDVQAEVEKQKRAHPKHLGGGPPSPVDKGGSLPAVMRGILESSIKPADWQLYDRKLESFYQKYGEHIHQLNLWAEVNARTICFDLWLVNDGNGTATDVDAYILFPSKIQFVAEAESMSRPLAPIPPDKPEPILDLIRRFSTQPSLGVRNIFDQDISFTRNREEPEVVVLRSPQNNFMIHARIKLLKHQQRVMLGTFSAVFADWTEVSPFGAKIVVSTIENPDKVEGDLPIIVTRAGAPRGSQELPQVPGS